MPCVLPIQAVIFDLDNTLWDWVALYTPAAIAMVDRAAELLTDQASGTAPSSSSRAEQIVANRAALTQGLFVVLEGHQDAEVPFALADTTIVQEAFPSADWTQRVAHLQPAFQVFNEIRSQFVKEKGLYGYNRSTGQNPTLTTLQTLRKKGVRVVAQSDALAVNALTRLKKFGIYELFDALYAIDLVDMEHPDLKAGDYYRQLLESKAVPVVRVPKADKKPNPELLRLILQQVGVRTDRAIFVGDSLSKDVAMANDAGVWAVHAKYGVSYLESPDWPRNNAFLSSIREYERGGKKGTPDAELAHSIADLFDFFTFEAAPR